jgi:HPr kinase/phosphorylase
MENTKKNIIQVFEPRPAKALSFIKVRTLYEDMREHLRLQVINGEYSFDRRIREKELNRPGLAFGGFVEVFTYWRVQIMGNTEIGYLNTLHGKKRLDAITTVLGFDLPCIIITNDNPIPKELAEIANHNAITLFSTPENTTAVHRHLSEYLDAKFAPHLVVHGTLVDLFSVGVLFAGPAAIGKSELALDLIERGHQLVADDAVELTKIGVNVVQGAPCGNIRHHMEIRGLGIIDVYKMFGVRGIRGKKDIHVVVKLEKYQEGKSYERIGLDVQCTKIMGVEISLVELPVIEGKNLTIVAEAIALNQKLKQIGVHQAAEFDRSLKNRLSVPVPDSEEELLDTEDYS